MPPLHLFVPGRLCLAGEHSDWASSFRPSNPHISPGSALILTLPLGIHAAIAPNPTHLHLSSPLFPPVTLTFSTLLPTAHSTSPWRFAAAAAYLIHQRFHSVHLLTLNITNVTLPPAKGLSSSAAICVLLVRAFNRLYNLHLSVPGEMDLAYAAERLTGSPCGRMDQVVAVGPAQVARMCFEGQLATHRLLTLPSQSRPIYIVLADLASHKDTRRILEALQGAFPDADTPQKRELQAVLGERNWELLDGMEGAIRNGDAKALGRAMTDWQDMFDQAAVKWCEDELRAPVLHRVLADNQVGRLVWGGKGVGSQGDGSVQFVARDYESAVALTHLLKERLGTEPYILPIGEGISIRGSGDDAVACEMARSMPTAQTVRTAVITAAGYGTRLFPASRSIRPKALFPIVDTDGFAKPLLLYLLEQCAEAGISRVVVVVGPGDQEERVREIFAPVPSDLFRALKPGMREYAERIQKLGSLVEITVQEEAKGFGDAVACADIGENCSFVLLLGDVVFKEGQGGRSCLRQAINAFEEDPTRGVIGVTPVDVSEAGAYGAVRVAGKDWVPGRRVGIEEVVEKPDRAKAEELSRDGKCWIVLGPYVFTPTLMRLLARDVEEDRRENGEIQLTSAMARVLDDEGLDCLCLQGEALDTGNAAEYARTISKLRD